MSEARGTPAPTTTEIPVAPPPVAPPPGGATSVTPAVTGAGPDPGPVPVTAQPGTPAAGGTPGTPATGETPATPAAGGPSGTPAEGHQPTAPVTGRPRIGPRRVSPLTRMGPWAPVAGAVTGLLGGLLVVLLLAGVADGFGERLALVFLTVGLAMLGASGALLADEVRLVRRGAREATIRPAWVEATANLLNGLTPARLLLLASAFVLFLAAYVS